MDGRARFKDLVVILRTGFLGGTAAPARFPNAYWVIPGRFLAGAYPGNGSTATARQDLSRLVAIGINSFLDLTEEREYGIERYAPLLKTLLEGSTAAISYRRMPITDHAIPDLVHMLDILDAIDGELAADRILYVHCFAGLGRTGTVVGCYLARHGISGEDALLRLARLRREMLSSGERSPITPTQRAMVRNWPAGH